MDNTISKGRFMTLAFISVVLLIDIICIVALYFIQSNEGNMVEARYNLFRSIFRMTLSGLLMFCLYQGQRWAKDVTVAIYLLGGAMSLLALFKGFNVINILLGLIYVFFGLFILLNKSIKSFLSYQTEKNTTRQITNKNRLKL